MTASPLLKFLKWSVASSTMSLLLYGGSYVALVGEQADNLKGKIVPTYRWGGETVATLYRPMHHLDTLVRPDKWNRSVGRFSQSQSPDAAFRNLDNFRRPE